MRRTHRLRLVFALIFMGLSPAASLSAQTLTTRDIVELTKAGLAEDVLLALIEVNRSVFPVDRATLASLTKAGVPPNVIVAMVRSGRDQVAPPAPQPQSQAILDHDALTRHDEEERARARDLERELERMKDREREREWEYSRVQRYSREVFIPVAVPVYVPVPVHRRESIRPADPVYWGWGGQLRPDAWKPADTRRHPKDPDREQY